MLARRQFIQHLLEACGRRRGPFRHIDGHEQSDHACNHPSSDGLGDGIEVGMQNAAQAIALATSPFVFDNQEMAIPAILYSLMMNVVLLSYVAIIKKRGQ